LTALRNVPVDGFAGTVATLKVELVRGNAVVGVDNFRINLGNAPPVASTPISNQTLTAREAAFEANLSSVFSDPDDSALSFSASSSDDGIASAAVSGETLTVTPLAAGTATITVEASDGTSDPGTTTFDVQVLKTDQRPDPVITSIESPPLQVELGKSFTIQLEAENQGDPANYGSITFSFPQLNKERDIEAVRLSSGSTSDDTPGYVKKAAGEEIFDRNSDPMTAQYLLVEYGDDNWRGGESNTLHLTVTPQEIGTFDVYARATFGINNEFVSTPATASTTDQQQWPVERFTLEVVEPRVAAPTDLTANAGESDVTLSWSASADSNVAGYNVYRSTRLFNTPGEATKLNSDPLPNLSYIDNNVTEATSYVYRVTAVAADDTESGLSDAANATVGGGGVNAPPEAIADTYTAAAGETLAVDAGRGVLANDTDPDGDDLTARLISDVSNGTLTLSDDGAFTYTPNDGFIGEDAFTYAARDGNGGSAEANVTFAVEEEDATPPAAPIDLAATATGAQIDLSWTASAEEDVAGYHVYRAETSFSDPADATKLTSSLLTDVSYVDTDVTGGTTYVYRVTATDDAGSESDLSAEASATLSETVTRSVAVVEGWNLRSVPVETDDMTLAGTFASCESAFRFTPGSGYASLGDAALSVGQGGFFNCSSGTVDLTGTPAASSVDVAAGWNLIGPQAEPVEVASITTEPVGLIESLFFGFAPDAGYASAETLEPTFGYWVKASAAGTIHMDGSGATTAATQAGPAAAPDGSLQEKPLRDAVRLVLTDATGRRQTLYLDAALTEDERSRFALPPVPPGDLFDVRFASGGIAETLAAPSGDRTAATTEATAPDPPAPDAHRVDLQGVTFPVTVRVADRAGQAEEAGSGRLRLEDPVHGHSLYLSEEAPEAVLQGPTDRVLVGLESVPEAYALGASYPNPASQRVTIEYALPEATEVTVEVYDLLGRRVLQAVGGQKAAGRHTVHLDARRLPSGTYFYRMRAGDFTAAKRLVVVR
jgi:fibronectin type 3 domain-containing protein